MADPAWLAKQVSYKRGWGKFKSGNEVEVDLADGGSETLSAKNIIIATGSEVTPLKGIDIDEERWALLLCRSLDLLFVGLVPDFRDEVSLPRALSTYLLSTSSNGGSRV